MRLLAFLLFSMIFIACDETNENPECPPNASCILPEDQMQAELDSLKKQIIQIAEKSTCSEASTCTFTGLGSKPCGGPWEYLVYSTSVDTATLNSLITQYNEKEHILNITSKRVSDCAIAQAPDSVVCQSTGCIAYLNGAAFSGNICCN